MSVGGVVVHLQVRLDARVGRATCLTNARNPLVSVPRLQAPVTCAEVISIAANRVGVPYRM